MPQFILTTDVAKKLNIKEFSEDNSSKLPFYDNWLVRLVKLSHDTLFFFAHMQTRMILSIPLFEVGSIEKVFDIFPTMLKDIMDEASVPKQIFIGNLVRNHYAENDITFCKAGINTRSVNAHITQYKRFLEHYICLHKGLNKLSCAVTSSQWLDNFITTPENKDYTTPQNLFLEQLSLYDEKYLGGNIIH